MKTPTHQEAREIAAKVSTLLLNYVDWSEQEITSLRMSLKDLVIALKTERASIARMADPLEKAKQARLEAQAYQILSFRGHYSELTPVREDYKGLVILYTTTPNPQGKFLFKAYRGTAAKPFAYYSISTRERLVREIAQTKASEDTSVTYRAERKASQKVTENPYKVGDIFYTSWGYDQTNLDFYEVVEVLAKSVRVRAIGSELQGDEGFMSGHYIARPGVFRKDEPVILCRARKGGITISGRSASQTAPGRAHYA